MTLTIGIVCKEGVVLAADKRGSLGHYVGSDKEDKIIKVANNIAITTAGSASHSQRVFKLIRAELELKRVRSKQQPSVREAANLVSNFLMGEAHFLVAGVDADGFHLYNVFPDGTIEKDNYATSGAYGVFIGNSVLDDRWKPNMTMEEGKKMAFDILRSTVKRDTTVGGGINVMTIDRQGVSEITLEKIAN